MHEEMKGQVIISRMGNGMNEMKHTLKHDSTNEHMFTFTAHISRPPTTPAKPIKKKTKRLAIIERLSSLEISARFKND